MIPCNIHTMDKRNTDNHLADTRHHWVPNIRSMAGPVYLAIADAIAADMHAGILLPGTRLPAQRALANALGIDFTTVSRAYALAREKGLVDARVGQGTFVRHSLLSNDSAASAGLVDMSMNLPPRIEDPTLSNRIWVGIANLQQADGTDLLSRYQDPAGTQRDRAAGAAWLGRRLGPLAIDRILVAPGAQGAITALLSSLTSPGDIVATEALTYPGFLASAASLKLNVLALAMDEAGLIPASLEQLCRTESIKILYCNPTMQNPTGTTLSLERRQQLVSIAEKYGVWIIEDDAYGALATIPTPTLASLAPEHVFHISTLAKCLSPALRIAYLVAPTASMQRQLSSAIRSLALMASPLTASIATHWIEDGTAEQIRSAIRSEAQTRSAIASKILNLTSGRQPEAFHAWLKLEAPWSAREFIAHLRSSGIAAVASDAFAAGQARSSSPIQAIRLGLGAPRSRENLEASLQTIANLLKESPAASELIV